LSTSLLFRRALGCSFGLGGRALLLVFDPLQPAKFLTPGLNEAFTEPNHFADARQVLEVADCLIDRLHQHIGRVFREELGHTRLERWGVLDAGHDPYALRQHCDGGLGVIETGRPQRDLDALFGVQWDHVAH
jgi:hypothetical protein